MRQNHPVPSRPADAGHAAVPGRQALRRRCVTAALAAGVSLAVAACGSGEVVVPAGTGGAAASSPGGSAVASSGASAAASSAASSGASAGASAGAGEYDVELPEFPVFRVPDISALTRRAARTQEAIAQSVDLPPGLEVTGARCDADGVVVNRSGATVGAGDDGSEVVSRAGVQRVGKGGSGQLVAGDLVYEVRADGSGEATNATATLQVNADGSGEYVAGDVVYTVNADGSGEYVDGENVYEVAADGSGEWTSALGPIENAGDGSGSWVGPMGALEVAGDGTGTLNGAPVRVAPMPPFALLGTLPKLSRLGPVGKPCGTLIRISAGLLFDFDSAQVRPEAQPVLRAVASALSGTSARIRVDGHTDAMGTDEYNLALSDRRAQAVVQALTAAGLDVPMTARGFGEAVPVAPNTLKGKDNPAGRQLNRRVEIVVPNR